MEDKRFPNGEHSIHIEHIDEYHAEANPGDKLAAGAAERGWVGLSSDEHGGVIAYINSEETAAFIQRAMRLVDGFAAKDPTARLSSNMHASLRHVLGDWRPAEKPPTRTRDVRYVVLYDDEDRTWDFSVKVVPVTEPAAKHLPDYPNIVGAFVDYDPLCEETDGASPTDPNLTVPE